MTPLPFTVSRTLFRARSRESGLGGLGAEEHEGIHQEEEEVLDPEPVNRFTCRFYFTF